MKSITEAGDLKGKRVLVRASLNVPVEGGVVVNEFRIEKALETIKYLSEEGAKVIVAAHIGRDREDSLRPVHTVLEKYISVSWCPTIDDVKAEIEEGAVCLLENLRSHEGETANDEAFAQELASLADIYVNDAFPASHREHASIVGVPKLLPHYAGIAFMREYENLKTLMQPESPSLFILGGAKFETKAPLIAQYVDVYDRVFVGGALANDFFKERGLEVGKSLVSDVPVEESLLSRENILLPVDVTVQNPEGVSRITSPDDVSFDESILDAGPETMKMLQTYIDEAHTILWNGPLGNYEMSFEEYTEELAKRIAESDAHSVLGGGDTIAATQKLGLEEKFSFVSAAGGAMLVFLETGTLPGIEALS